MEMCYDGALVMPSSYAVMNEDEMTYVDGGINKTYTGSQGWAVAAALTGSGTFIYSMAGGLSKAIILSALSGGPIAWIIAGVTTAALMSAAAYLGSQLSGAGLQAAYNMRKKGKFTLKSTNNPFGLLSVS